MLFHLILTMGVITIIISVFQMMKLRSQTWKMIELARDPMQHLYSYISKDNVLPRSTHLPPLHSKEPKNRVCILHIFVFPVCRVYYLMLLSGWMYVLIVSN